MLEMLTKLMMRVTKMGHAMSNYIFEEKPQRGLKLVLGSMRAVSCVGSLGPCAQTVSKTNSSKKFRCILCHYGFAVSSRTRRRRCEAPNADKKEVKEEEHSRPLHNHP